MEQDNDGVDGQSALEAPKTPTKIDRAKFLTSKLKSSAKRLIGQDDSDSAEDSDGVSELFEDAAFNPQQVLEASPHQGGSLRDKLHREAHGLAATLKNPRRAIRSRYTRTVAGNVGGQPAAYDSKYDEELVKAHDALERAVTHDKDGSRREVDYSRTQGVVEEDGSEIQCTEAKVDESTSARTDNVEMAKARFQKVESERDSLRTAWILGRHVKRVRVPRPMSHRPVKSDFMQRTPDGQGQKVRWGHYLAARALWETRGFTPSHIDDFDALPFDLREVSLAVERLAIVSAPWQSFFMEVRQVYLWENPRRTLKFLGFYSVLWYFQYVPTAALAAAIVVTIKNKIRPGRIESIRKQVQRAQDERASAQAWGELIQRHGKHDWIEPFLDEVGPLLQLELSDMSNLLEMLQCFYRWERPRQTMATLFFLIVSLLLGLLTDLDFCVKLFWLGAGFFFFFTLPLAARYPKYRRLVNPVYWILWDFPNMAELSIVRLQEKAIMRDAARLEKRGTTDWEFGQQQFTSEDEDEYFSANDTGLNASQTDSHILQTIWDEDQVTFRSLHSETHDHGRLKLLRHGLWYYDKKVKSYHAYSNLSEIKKIDISIANDPDASRMSRLVRRIGESTSLKFLPSEIEFLFLPHRQSRELRHTTPQDSSGESSKVDRLTLMVSESDRDKIFSLVISWSDLKWQPIFSSNEQNRLSADSEHPNKLGKGNKNLDKVIKSFVQ